MRPAFFAHSESAYFEGAGCESTPALQRGQSDICSRRFEEDLIFPAQNVAELSGVD